MVLTDDDGARRARCARCATSASARTALPARRARPQLPPDEPAGRARRRAARAHRRDRRAQALARPGVRERLARRAGLQLPVEEPWARSVYWMYGVVLDEDVGDRRRRARPRGSRERGVETRPFFLGMHEQPALHARGLFAGERYPVAERLARQGLYLPSGLALTDEQQIDRSATRSRRSCRERRRSARPTPGLRRALPGQGLRARSAT